MNNLTEGQTVALGELEEISTASENALIIKSTDFPQQKPGTLTVRVSYLCDYFERNHEVGLPLNHRESFDILIAPNFPFSPPKIKTTHIRFNGVPHVQWTNQLCLYQAEATEWSASDGMVGFFERLKWWLKQGAIGELDPAGGPIHPPVAYLKSSSPGIIPVKNTPIVESTPWLGFAHITYPFPHFCEIRDWSTELPASKAQFVAPAFLLADKMPFEFPERVDQLIKALEDRGISRSDFFFYLYLALYRNPENAPLIIVVGTPMRGISGYEKSFQHLSAWKLIPDSLGFKTLKLGLDSLKLSLDDNPEIAQKGRVIGYEARELFDEWASHEQTKVIWLRIREARPEVTRQRDENSTMNWFKEKTIAIWGCGAMGSVTAEILCRAGVKKFILRDEGEVALGLLVRQFYNYEDIHTPKCTALKKRLQQINPNIEIETSAQDILESPLGQDDWTENADLIVESTGSNALLQKLELQRSKNPNFRTQILSMTIGHQAEFGMACLSKNQYSGGIKDIERKVKIVTSRKPELKCFADEFWPEIARTNLFQPEPGCSEPTFVGAAADIVSFASRLLKLASTHIASESTNATAILLHSPTFTQGAQEEELCFGPDIIVKDFHERFEIRCSENAWKEILAWKKKSQNENPVSETGGLLFGEYDTACHVFWISDASGPSPDSTASPTGFQCGTVGAKELQEYHNNISRGSVKCVGLWHTHPESVPLPSTIDIEGMNQIINESGVHPKHSLLWIVGDAPHSASVFAAVFSRNDKALIGKPSGKDLQSLPPEKELSGSRSIGLALSGGGARAMAFHLGCLRALYHRGVLERIKVISSISGGSVIGAMYAYSDGSFEEFENAVRSILRKGFLKSLVQKIIFSPLFFASIFTIFTSGLLALLTDFFRCTATSILSLFGKYGRHVSEGLKKIQPPWTRWFNRSDALEKVLSKLVYGNKTLSTKRRNGIDIIVNATELRTGTAFRFGSQETGSSRHNRVENGGDIKISEAVAASASFPIILPAFDRKYKFSKKNGQTESRRVLLTDGGVYDNLGLTPLEPGRSPEYSFNICPVDYIISCSAGAGISNGETIPYWWPTRMIQSFDSTFRRVQEWSMKALHHYLHNGQLKGFILAYLGQVDSKLPCPPADLVPRDLVKNYPTNFSAMKEEDIELLSKRGEQLMRLLIARYNPEL